MARYYGSIGYRTTTETAPGIWEETITEHMYYGDIVRNYMRHNYDQHMTTNSTPECNNSISILADPYAFENFHSIVYATFMGTKWTVSNVEVQYPRLILSLGRVYNDESIDTP